MSEAFMAHVEALEPGSAGMNAFMEAMRSRETALAYAATHDLELSADDAAFIADATSGPVDDAAMEGVSGGGGYGGAIIEAWRKILRSSSEP